MATLTKQQNDSISPVELIVNKPTLSKKISFRLHNVSADAILTLQSYIRQILVIIFPPHWSVTRTIQSLIVTFVLGPFDGVLIL